MAETSAARTHVQTAEVPELINENRRDECAERVDTGRRHHEESPTGNMSSTSGTDDQTEKLEELLLKKIHYIVYRVVSVFKKWLQI